ncbi:hypothetical protein [Nonomuraea sp. 10N515B]|uniref:hypothetical protein n=1 Tax=Nonomuraea sp. 10N515B TaxID=3457422 RepID=UPI003FCEB6AC
MTSVDWVTKNPQTLAAFQRAFTKAQRLATSDRKEVEAVLPTYVKIDAATATQTSLGAYPTAVDPCSGWPASCCGTGPSFATWT